MGTADRRRWRSFRFWHLVVSGLVSAAAGAAVNIATAAPGRLVWVVAAALLVVGTIGLGAWQAGRDERAEAARAGAARAEVMDPFWPTPVDLGGSVSDAAADGLLFWLRAPFCPSPLRGRSGVLRSLTQWCQGGNPDDVVRIVAGPAGVGKSRLVVEVARRLGEGWFAGKPDPARLADAVERVLACGQPALLVVEDAERVPGVARLVARVGTARGLVRLVLTSRDGSGLRQRLRQDPDTSVGPLLRGPVVELTPIGRAGDRLRWYAEAVHEYAHALRMPRPDVIDTVPVGHDGDLMLLIQARALLAVLNRPGSRLLDLADVARELVGMETRRWENDATSPVPVTGDVLAQAVAVLSLLPAADALRRLPRLAADAAEQTRLAIVAWARARYPVDSAGRLEVQPHLIGEWLILDTLATVPTLAADLPAEVVETVARACTTYPGHLPRLWAVLRANPDRLPELIGMVIRHLTAVDRVDQGIEQLIGTADPGLHDALLALELPPDFGHARVALSRIRVRRLRAQAEPDRLEIAAAMTDLGVGLGQVGRRQEALAVDQEAVGIWRELDAAEPGRHRYRLAMALSNLGNTASGLGRHGDALVARAESVALWRELHDAEPDGYQAELATDLSNLGGSLAQTGRYAEALPLWRQSVAIWRESAAVEPAGRYILAGTLSGLGLVLRESGVGPESIAAGQESVAIWRDLSAAELDRHRAEFAGALARLGGSLWTSGQYRGALAAVEEAVGQWRAVVAVRPDRYRPDFAEALNSLGVCLSSLGRRREALAADQEAVAICRAVVAVEPGHHRPRLASTLAQLAVDLASLGDHRKAIAAGEEAVAIRRELAAAAPDRYRSGLADVLHNLGVSHDEVGNRDTALELWREALELFQICARRDPGVYRERCDRLTERIAAT